MQLLPVLSVLLPLWYYCHEGLELPQVGLHGLPPSRPPSCGPRALPVPLEDQGPRTGNRAGVRTAQKSPVARVVKKVGVPQTLPRAATDSKSFPENASINPSSPLVFPSNH